MRRIYGWLTIAALAAAPLCAQEPSISKELLSSSYSGGVTTLDWVVRFDDNGTTVTDPVTITDNFNAAQTYLPPSEAHPNGWSVTQNPSGFVWQSGSGSGYSREFPTPNMDVSLPGGGTGDGYAPIPYTALNGDKRFYYLNHYQNFSFPLFGCIGACGGSTWPKRLPDGDPASTDTSGTSYAPETVLLNRKLYYPVTRANDAGIGCYDLETDTECGYIQLTSALGRFSGMKSVTDGLVNIGNTLYIMDGNAKVYKVSVSTTGSMTLVGSIDTTINGMLNNDQVTSGSNRFYGIGSKTINNKVFFLKDSNNPNNRKILCLDTSGAMSVCPGWNNAKTLTSIGLTGTNGFFYYTPSMTATEICVSSSSNYARPQQCLSLNDGTPVVHPDIFSGSVFHVTSLEATVGTKTYFPTMQDGIMCYDWVAGSLCSPSFIVRAGSGDTQNSTNTQNYGSVYDGEGCIWNYGHQNKLWSFNPQTGATPCQSGSFVMEDTYDASHNWCASENVSWHYTHFQISGLTPGMFSDLNITFYDANGNVIKFADLPTNVAGFSQGLMTAPFVPGEPIHYKIEGIRNPSANPNLPAPVVTIGVEGPPKEFCFQTTVPCPVTGDIHNDVTLNIGGQNVDSFEVNEGAQLLCEEVLPQPQQCLDARPLLECSPVGWTVKLQGMTPSTFNASNTQMYVRAPSGATATKWGDTWYLNGVNAGDTVQLAMNGVQQGGGAHEGNDLCCDGEVNVTISASQQCVVMMPEINVMKSYEDGVFKLHAGVLGEIHEPMRFTISDTIPAGITITGIDPRSPDWQCAGNFPVGGPAVLNCVYTGQMPVVTGAYDLYLTTTLHNSVPVQNCMNAGVIQTDGTTLYTDPMMHHCVEINATQDNNDTPPSGGCEVDSDCAQGQFCHQGYCADLPPDGNTTGEDIPFTCSSNIIVVADESGSIAVSGATFTVRNAIRSLVKGYKGHGSKAAVIHFATNANVEKPMTTIETASGAPYQENWFTSNYAPLSGQTNWEAGLKLALAEVNANPGPELVFFITDGQPNRYLDNNGNVQTGTESVSVAEAVGVANQINAAGGRIIAIGVGDIASSPTAQNNLNQIAATSDDAIVGETTQLGQIISDYVGKSCSDILLEKYASDANINLANTSLSQARPRFTLKVINSSPVAMTNVVVEDALPTPKLTFDSFVSPPSLGTAVQSTPNVVRWTIPSLAANSSATLNFKVKVSGVQVGERVYNYAQIVSIDQTVASTPNNLSNPVSGPLNPSDRDEGMASVYVYEHNSTQSEGGLYISKTQKPGEGNCAPGHECHYTVTIRNTHTTQPYTQTLNISDGMIPASATSPITITAQGSAPDPMCTPAPTSIPFTCTQTADIPPSTTWTYDIVMQTTPQGATRNNLEVNNQTKGFNFPTNNRSAAVPLPPKPKLTVTKTAPKVCVAGKPCTFTLRVTNRAKTAYSGPLSITDRSKEFVGKLIRTAGKGWKCRTTRRGYTCNIAKVTLGAGESSTVKLTVRIPQRAKGYLHNCAKLDGLKGSNRVRALQTMLLQKGFDPNGIDGGMGKGTKRALSAYMKSKGLKGKKAQKRAIAQLVSEYPAPVSADSCVKVKIKQVCQPDEKRVGDRCKPRCKKWQHWDGRHCVSCDKGTKWDKRKRKCIAQKCPQGTVRHGKKCIKVKKQSEKPKCIPFVTHYNELLGICVPNVSIGIGGSRGNSGGGQSAPVDVAPH